MSLSDMSTLRRMLLLAEDAAWKLLVNLWKQWSCLSLWMNEVTVTTWPSWIPEHEGDFIDAFFQSDSQWFIHTFIHWLWWLPLQGANQHIGSSWGFNIFPKDTLTYTQAESNQRRSNHKIVALPLSPSHTPWKCCWNFLCSSCIRYFCIWT